MVVHPRYVKAHTGAMELILAPWRLTLKPKTGSVEAHPGAMEDHSGTMDLTPEPQRLTLEWWRLAMETRSSPLSCGAPREGLDPEARSSP